MTQTLTGIIITPSGTLHRTQLHITDPQHQETGTNHGEIIGETVLDTGETDTATFVEIRPLNTTTAMCYQWEDHGCTNWIYNAYATAIEQHLSNPQAPLDLTQHEDSIKGDVAIITAKAENGELIYSDITEPQIEEIKRIIESI